MHPQSFHHPSSHPSPYLHSYISIPIFSFSSLSSPPFIHFHPYIPISAPISSSLPILIPIIIPIFRHPILNPIFIPISIFVAMFPSQFHFNQSILSSFLSQSSTHPYPHPHSHPHSRLNHPYILSLSSPSPSIVIAILPYRTVLSCNILHT